MRTMMLVVAMLVAASCGTEQEQATCDEPGDVTPGTIEINTEGQELGFGADDAWARVPTQRVVPTCEEPTLLVESVGPMDNPIGEFLGIAVTVKAKNCAVTVNSITFQLLKRDESGHATGFVAPASFVTHARIATGNPEVPVGDELLGDELTTTPVGALAWSTYDPIVVPKGETRDIGLFAELGIATHGTYLFAFIGAQGHFDTGARAGGLIGPHFGIPFHVAEPVPPACRQPSARVWGLAPADNTSTEVYQRVFVAEVKTVDCDVFLDAIEIGARGIVDYDGYGGEEQAMFTNLDVLAADLYATVRLDSTPADERFTTTFEPVEGLSANRRVVTNISIPAGDSAIIEVYLKRSADAQPGKYLFSLEAVSSRHPESDSWLEERAGMPRFGIPFAVTE